MVANSIVYNSPASGNITVTFELSEPIGIGSGNNGLLDCVAFYEVGGMNAPGFNNDQTNSFQGDWKGSTQQGSPPANLICRQPVARRSSSARPRST